MNAGAEREEIVKLLLRESRWESLAGWLDMDDALVAINQHCGTQGSAAATCSRSKLVEEYCQKTAKSSVQVATDIATALERVGNKRLADELRQLFGKN